METQENLLQFNSHASQDQTGLAFFTHWYCANALFLNLNCFPRLKPLDIQVMKALHHKVNIVPIIAKADTLTLKEVKSLKQKVSLLEEEKLPETDNVQGVITVRSHLCKGRVESLTSLNLS